MMTLTACWADPLTKAERRKLADALADACGRFYRAASYDPNSKDLAVRLSRLEASAEMSDLHLDVTERAEVAAS